MSDLTCRDKCGLHRFCVCVPTKYLPANSKLFNEHEYQLALNSSQYSFCPSSVSNLSSVRDSEEIRIHWDASQMSYLDKKCKTKIKSLTPNASNLERSLTVL